MVWVYDRQIIVGDQVFIIFSSDDACKPGCSDLQIRCLFAGILTVPFRIILQALASEYRSLTGEKRLAQRYCPLPLARVRRHKYGTSALGYKERPRTHLRS